MYQGLLLTHTYLRYFIVILLVIVIIISLVGLMAKKPYTKKDNKVGLFLFICTHMQLLIGIILYIVSLSNDHRVKFIPETMKTPALRYFAVEHTLAMLIAIALITIARISAKKTQVDQVKHQRMLVYNGIALAIIVVMVFVVGRPYNTY